MILNDCCDQVNEHSGEEQHPRAQFPVQVECTESLPQFIPSEPLLLTVPGLPENEPHMFLYHLRSRDLMIGPCRLVTILYRFAGTNESKTPWVDRRNLRRKTIILTLVWSSARDWGKETPNLLAICTFSSKDSNRKEYLWVLESTKSFGCVKDALNFPRQWSGRTWWGTALQYHCSHPEQYFCWPLVKCCIGCDNHKHFLDSWSAWSLSGWYRLCLAKRICCWTSNQHHGEWGASHGTRGARCSLWSLLSGAICIVLSLFQMHRKRHRK